jgi:hypothetical protein
MRLSLAVAVLLWSISALSQPFECGTTAEHEQFVRASAEFLELRAARMAAKGVPESNAALSNNIFIVRADDTNTPYRRPFDLQSKTLELTPAGEDTFTARVGSLHWDGNLGRELIGGESRAWNLANPFTIFGREVRTLYVTERTSIHLDAPKLPTGRQFGDYELASFEQAVIAPLMLTDLLRQRADPSIHVRESGDSLLVTWMSGTEYAVQAAIFADGRIRLSYLNVGLPAGGVLVTSGAEGWREQRTPLVEVTDPVGDILAETPERLRGMLDIESVTINRLADLDLAEVRITLAEAPDFHHVPIDSWVTWNVVAGDDPASQVAARVVLYGTGTDLRVTIPVFSGSTDSPAAAVEGRTLIVRLPDEFLQVAAHVTVAARVENERNIDVVASRPLVLPEPARRMRTDLSAADGATLRMPVVEAFTMPVLAPQRVWDQIRYDYGLDGENVDAVAIYQTFPTDIQLYAGAYAVVGNPGASGIRVGDETSAGTSKVPSLLHMNQLNLGRSDRSDSHVLLHEFGHRWLYFFMLMENGAPRFALNPLRQHPAQFVHTPAAFNVHANDDASAMGGGTFRDLGNGSFTSGSATHNGYSWLDLYLMGLAAPEEVAPFYYIANSNPKLADAYYAPRNTTVRGTRKNVTVQQVIDATGPRRPGYAESQKQFRVAFVLLTEGEPSESQLNRMNALRDLMARDFQTATGGRATIATTFTAPPVAPSGPRRRAIRK